MYPFEHQGEDGKWYLHFDNWKAFKDNLEKQYPHNWLHRRVQVTLIYPRLQLDDVPAKSHDIRFVEDDWSVIFDVYPAHMHIAEDNNDTGESYILFAEDKHAKPTFGPPITFFSTTSCCLVNNNSLFLHDHEIFAYFNNKYFKVFEIFGGYLGHHPPPKQKIKSKKCWRSIDDDWNNDIMT